MSDSKLQWISANVYTCVCRCQHCLLPCFCLNINLVRPVNSGSPDKHAKTNSKHISPANSLQSWVIQSLFGFCSLLSQKWTCSSAEGRNLFLSSVVHVYYEWTAVNDCLNRKKISKRLHIILQKIFHGHQSWTPALSGLLMMSVFLMWTCWPPSFLPPEICSLWQHFLLTSQLFMWGFPVKRGQPWLVCWVDKFPLNTSVGRV